MEQINAIMRIYPSPDVLSGLLEEAKNTSDDEKWDKGEDYFLQLMENKAIKQRLMVW